MCLGLRWNPKLRSRSTRGPLGPKVEQAAARIPSQPQTHMVTAHPGFSHPSYSMNMPAGLCTMLQVLSARSPGRCVSGNEMRRFRNSRRVFETFGWLKCFWDKKLKLSEEGSKSPRRGVKNQTSEKTETRRERTIKKQLSLAEPSFRTRSWLRRCSNTC